MTSAFVCGGGIPYWGCLLVITFSSELCSAHPHLHILVCICCTIGTAMQQVVKIHYAYKAMVLVVTAYMGPPASVKHTHSPTAIMSCN